jgi:putative ABC transport system permease protein
MHQLLSILDISLILSFVVMASVLTFRFAGFPDLSVDGVFSLGAVVFAKLYMEGWDVPQAFVGAMVAGGIIGFITASISVRLRINPLLASVLMLTMLYSLNFRILGQANMPIYGLLDTGWSNPWIRTGIFLTMASVLLLASVAFFKTQFGAALRSTGSSPDFLVSVGRNVNLYRTILVALAGILVAVSGALLTMKFGFADVSMGTGTIIIGIASLIIGEKITGRHTFVAQLLAAFLGIFIYELAVGVALSAGISPTDVKLGTGVITILLLALSSNERDRLFA